MDFYSRFIEILSLVEITSQAVIQKLKSAFPRWSIPEELVSDSGTESAMFDEFKASMDLSIPHQAHITTRRMVLQKVEYEEWAVLEPKLPDHAAVKKADVRAKRGCKESFDRQNGKRAPATSTRGLGKSQAG